MNYPLLAVSVILLVVSAVLFSVGQVPECQCGTSDHLVGHILYAEDELAECQEALLAASWDAPQ